MKHFIESPVFIYNIIYKQFEDVATEYSNYRVFSKGRKEVGPSKSIIFGTFSDVLDFFLTIQYGRFFILVLLRYMIEKKLKNLILQKG